MIQNILVEASRGEVVLTSRPRVIALPPLSVSRWGRRLRRRGARGAGAGRGGQAWPEASLQPLSGAFCLPGLRLPTCFRRRLSGCHMPKCPAWRCRPLPTLRGCHGPAPPTCCPQGPLSTAPPLKHLAFCVCLHFISPTQEEFSSALWEGQMVGAAEVDCSDSWPPWVLGGCFSPLHGAAGPQFRPLAAGRRTGLASGGRFGRGLTGLCPGIAGWTGTELRA